MPERLPQPKRLVHSQSEPAVFDPDNSANSNYESNREMSARPGRYPKQDSGNFNNTASVGLYATPSFSSLYVEPEDLEPGPGTYNHANALGQQYLSTRETLPLVSLTAKHDRSWAKVMISKDHLNAIKARGTPGPGTYEPGLVPSQARVRFGSARRKGLAETSFKAPGPVYEVRSAPDNPPQQVKFSKATRFGDGSSLTSQLGSTGPGQYELDTIFDGVNLAKSFGASHRAYDHVRFPGSERTMVGRASPGPGAARDFQNDGSQVSFGRAERLPTNQASKRSPGPGAYEQHNKPYPHSRNMSTYSFGRPQARGRINWGAMKNAQNTAWGIQ